MYHAELRARRDFGSVDVIASLPNQIFASWLCVVYQFKGGSKKYWSLKMDGRKVTS